MKIKIEQITKTEFEGWLTALRSGKYKQGYGQLKLECDESTSYCCLGVLCEVMGLVQINENMNCTKETKTFLYQGEQSYAALPFGNGDLLPKEGASIFTNDAALPHKDLWNEEQTTKYGHLTRMSLTRLNDSSKYTFNDIADIIETFFEAA